MKFKSLLVTTFFLTFLVTATSVSIKNDYIQTSRIQTGTDSLIIEPGIDTEGIDTRKIKSEDSMLLTPGKNLEIAGNIDLKGNNIQNLGKINSIRTDTVKIVSKGYKSDRGSPGVWINGEKILETKRSYGLVVLDRETHEVSFKDNYDVFDKKSEAERLGNKLQSLNNNQLAIITTYDEPRNNRESNNLPENITRLGGSGAFSSDSFQYRSAYMLVGTPGLGKGEAYETYRGDKKGDQDAYIQRTFTLKNGWPTVLDSSSTEIRKLGYGTSLEMNGNRIKGVENPEKPKDAATKDYVDMHVPSGAVMAFNRNSCPEGWKSLEKAKGRVIVGKDSSDSDFKNLKKTGGEKKHKLTVEELPSHSHNYNRVNPDKYGTGIDGDWGNLEYPEYTTSSTGGDKPHNNLQPYLVLKYCEKD